MRVCSAEAVLQFELFHRLLYQFDLAGVFAALRADQQVQSQGQAFAAGERAVGLVGHTFFMFQNADTGDINVVYKRKDGNYGRLEPMK